MIDIMALIWKSSTPLSSPGILATTLENLSRKFLNVSPCLYLSTLRDKESFFGNLLVKNWFQNLVAKASKLAMELASSYWYQVWVLFWRVVENTLHMMASLHPGS